MSVVDIDGVINNRSKVAGMLVVKLCSKLKFIVQGKMLWMCCKLANVVESVDTDGDDKFVVERCPLVFIARYFLSKMRF